jgi:hypothetical protein
VSAAGAANLKEQDSYQAPKRLTYASGYPLSLREAQRRSNLPPGKADALAGGRLLRRYAPRNDKVLARLASEESIISAVGISHQQ